MRKVLMAFTMIFAMAAFLMSSGCAVHMLANAPDRIEVDSVKPGIYRAEVIAQFGQPVASGKDDNNNDFETFAFKTGSSGFAKLTRGLWYGLTDLASLGAAEILWTFIESSVQSGRIIAKVTYDSRGKVIDVKIEKAPDISYLRMNYAKAGMYRADIVAYYGSPLGSGKDESGRDFDVFSFLETFSIQSSTEVEWINIKVTYDTSNKVSDIKELKDKALLKKIQKEKERE
ncbi:MAG: hypothetical protein AAB757_01790 [Patescibacteria group bacterium]